MKSLAIVLTTFSLLASAQARLDTVEPIKIGFVSAATGADPNTSMEIKRGLDLYLDTHPKASKRFAVTAFDNKGDVQETVAIVDRAAKAGFKILTGIARSDEALAAAQVTSKQGLIFLTPFATNPKLTSLDSKTIQICFADDYQGAALAKLVKQDLKPKRLLILVNAESVYSTGLSQRFTDALKDAKITTKQIEYTERDLRQELIERTATELKPDVIFIPDHITRAAILAKGLNATLKGKVVFLGGDGFGGKKVLTGVFGDTPNITLYYSTHWHSKIDTRMNREFIAAYVQAYPGAEPTSGAAMMYDLMSTLYGGVEKAGGDPEAIVKALRGQSFETTTGRLEIPAALGKSAVKPVVILRLKDNEYGFYKTVR